MIVTVQPVWHVVSEGRRLSVDEWCCPEAENKYDKNSLLPPTYKYCPFCGTDIIFRESDPIIKRG